MAGTLEKFLMGLVAIGFATAILLPGRQTVPAVKAAGGFVQGGLRTAITGR
jgi:hypothetical protein